MADSDPQSSTSTETTVSSIVTTTDSFTEPAAAPQVTVSTAVDDITPQAPPLPIRYFGLSVRDCSVLVALVLLCAGLSWAHYLRMSAAGQESVEIERLPERIYDYKIDINQATFAEWSQLPGIGEKLAERILEHREQHGPFKTIDDLDEIRGIGVKTLAKIRPWLTVSEPAD